MTNRCLKSVVLLAAIAAIVAGVSLYVLGREPSPSPTSSSISVTAAPVSISPVATFAAATTQPKITWTTTGIDIILSPGKSTTSDLTFTSSQKLTSVSLSVVPQIAPFVRLQPSSISSLGANQAVSVQLLFAVSPNTKLGTYNGTLQLKSGTTTFPQTVKIVIRVAGVGAAIFLPPDPGNAGKTTLQGIDSDADGIRDDLERYIDLTFPSSAKTRAALDQLVVQAQLTLVQADDSAAANLHTKESLPAINCLSFIVGSEASAHIYDGLRAQLLNTMPRSMAWIKSSKAFSGQVVRGMVDRKAGCDFDPNLMEN